MTLISRLLNSRPISGASHQSARRPVSRRLRFESLENRSMLTAVTHFGVLAPSSVTAGAAFNVTVTALDQLDNPVAGYTGTVHFTSTSGAAVLPADSLLTSGVGTFSTTLNSLGNQTISVFDTADNSILGTSGLIAVKAATSVVISSTPNPSRLGQQVSFTATVSSVNPADGTPGGTVQFVIDGSNFSSPIALSVGGLATVTDTVLAAGSHTITATYSGDSLHAGSASLPLTQNVLSVQQQVQIIQQQVGSLPGLNAGNKNSLLVKLELKDNHGDHGKVQAFIHEIKAFVKAHKISPADATTLVTEANELLVSLKFVETSAHLQAASGPAKHKA